IYTTQGALEKVSSIDSQNAVLNEVKYEYDANLKLKKLYQSYSGSVTTSTPSLEYTYDSAHDNRLTNVTYPSGKTIEYNYDSFDNVTSINEGTTPLVSYLYDGSGSPMQTTYNQPNVTLTYANGGLDRYGRIVNHSWVKNNNALVHIVHGYNYAGNRLYRNDLVQSANSELYGYDNLGQIKTLNRGELNSAQNAVTTVNHSESWNFDKTGNWLQYTKNNTTENRTHNAANELQGIATHDANGNMILMPGLKGKYDAWNRLVEVRGLNDNLIAQHEYNGLNQRIKKTVGSTVTKSFFNENWQEIESQTGSEITSYIWGLRYIDDLVLREKGEERLYSLADSNWNIVAICDASGDIQERYTYDAFGKRNIFDADFTEKTETEFDWNRAFTGQVLDAETGVMLYRERYYEIQFGRFVNRDPIEYWAEDANLYRYIFNVPIDGLDPEGLSVVWDWVVWFCWVDQEPHSQPGTLGYYANEPSYPGGMSRQNRINASNYLAETFEEGIDYTQDAVIGVAIGGVSGKVAGNLISGTLKKSDSYASELANKTFAELQKTASGKGPMAIKSKKMLKLIKESKRLGEKQGGKPKR
ncbi:MAG: hypothetical protein LBJ00_13285, partial [Planctomycetaceae bacterium]|nr:hypothetical protein [Planctomycetaceae bacterium]